MAIAPNAKVNVDITADGRTARQELDSVYAKVNRIGGASTAVFGGMIPLASAAAVGVAAVGAAALTAATAIFNLTRQTSDYGSEIFDATQKTRLSAETISALRFAADQSGASFESIVTSVAKFNNLLGQAQLGNTKAAKTLADFNITARDSETALGQALAKIASYKDENAQAAAAATLFKDKSGEVIKVIREFDGDLPALMTKLRDLGLLMKKENARASDEFGDTLDTLTKQASATGREFAFGLMPYVTHAMAKISASMAGNQSVARQWGESLGQTVHGVELYFGGLNTSVQASLNGINRAYGTNLQATIDWAGVMQSVISPLLGMFNLLGKLNPVGFGVGSWDMPPSPPPIPKIRTPKLSAAASGKSDAEREAERRAREAEEIARRNLAARLRMSDMDLANEWKLFDEQVQNVSKHLEENTELLAGYDDRHDLTVEGGIENLEIYIGKLQEAQRKLHDLQLDKAKDFTDDERTLLSKQQAEEKLELTRKTAAALQEVRDKAVKVRQDEEIARIDRLITALEERQRLEQESADLAEWLNPPENRMQKPERRDDLLAPLTDSGPFDSFIKGIAGYLEGIAMVRDANGELHFSMKQTFESIAQMGVQAFGQLAAGFGELVSNWILYGDAAQGGFRKMIAGIVANISKMATTYAIMCLAAAALATTAWGAAMLGGTPGQFLKAAALFGAVAVAAAAGGRAIAGDSFKGGDAFKGAAGAATGQPGARDDRNYTTTFGGFRNEENNPITRAVNRLTVVMGQVEETVHDFKQKFGVASPGDVVMAGAFDASRSIRDAYHAELAGDVTSTAELMRNTGMAR